MDSSPKTYLENDIESLGGSMAGAWLVEWLETERGWGMRPDGAYYFPSKEKAEEETEKELNRLREEEAKQGFGYLHAPDIYSFPELPPQLFQ